MLSDKIDTFIRKPQIFHETPSIIGSINISHHITCPHCHCTIFDDLDREWWVSNVTDQLPNVDCYKDKYEVKCKECSNPFIINGFEY